MKIVLVSDCYPPRVGGIESHVHDLAHRLADAGHEVEVLTATQGDSPGASRGPGTVTVHRLGTWVPFGLPVNPAARSALHRFLSDDTIDVVHVHVGVISPFAFDGARIALAAGRAVAVTWHCVLGAWAPVVDRLGHARAWLEAGAAHSAVSQMAASQVIELIDGTAEVTVLPNGIEVAAWRPDPAPELLPGSASPVTVIVAMRFTPRKRPLRVIRLVRAARRHTADAVDLRLEICGGGPLLALVRAVTQRRGEHGWVSLPGRIPRQELRQRYANADIYLAPSRFESFGIAALEGRTAGLPVVGLASSGVAEFVTDGVTGLLADSDETLSAAIARLATDPELRARLTTHNRRTPPAQDWPAVIAATEREYARARQQRVAP